MTDEQHDPSGVGDPDEPSPGTDQNGGAMREIVDGPVGSAHLRLPSDGDDATRDDQAPPPGFEPPDLADDD